jgi:DNA-binding response OmpR family regulator
MASILVLDDDPHVLDAMTAMLEGAGHSVRAAADGRAGLQSFQASRPDLVVTDIIMPHREGIETIRAIRAADALVPIIAISGGGRFRSVDFLTLAMQLGADAALAKPFAAAELLGTIARLLESAS